MYMKATLHEAQSAREARKFYRNIEHQQVWYFSIILAHVIHLLILIQTFPYMWAPASIPDRPCDWFYVLEWD